jgi:hypothetical protein
VFGIESFVERCLAGEADERWTPWGEPLVTARFGHANDRKMIGTRGRGHRERAKAAPLQGADRIGLASEAALHGWPPLGSFLHSGKNYGNSNTNGGFLGEPVSVLFWPLFK